jgi:hypothetical protein
MEALDLPVSKTAKDARLFHSMELPRRHADTVRVRCRSGRGAGNGTGICQEMLLVPVFSVNGYIVPAPSWQKAGIRYLPRWKFCRDGLSHASW